MGGCTPRQTANWQQQRLIGNSPESTPTVAFLQTIPASGSTVARGNKSATVLFAIPVKCALYSSNRQYNHRSQGRTGVLWPTLDVRSLAGDGFRAPCRWCGIRLRGGAVEVPKWHLQRRNPGRCSTTQPSHKGKPSMVKLPVAILGSGNIGTDLMYKVRRSALLELKIGRRHRSGLRGFGACARLGYETCTDGIEGVLRNAQLSWCLTQLQRDLTSRMHRASRQRILSRSI